MNKFITKRNVTVSIIGTAGRKEDHAKLTKEVFNSMKKRAMEIIKNVFQLDISSVTLVSGGSAWADHIAVRLWLESLFDENPSVGSFHSLTLFLPYKLQQMANKVQFEDLQGSSWRDNPGKVLNELHSRFSDKMKEDFNSFNDLVSAQGLGATLDTSYHGFHNRNKQVAKSDYLIAFTWGNSKSGPKNGGTFHTWSNCKTVNKIHVPLSELEEELKEERKKHPPSIVNISMVNRSLLFTEEEEQHGAKRQRIDQ